MSIPFSNKINFSYFPSSSSNFSNASQKSSSLTPPSSSPPSPHSSSSFLPIELRSDRASSVLSQSFEGSQAPSSSISSSSRKIRDSLQPLDISASQKKSMQFQSTPKSSSVVKSLFIPISPEKSSRGSTPSPLSCSDYEHHFLDDEKYRPEAKASEARKVDFRISPQLTAELFSSIKKSFAFEMPALGSIIEASFKDDKGSEIARERATRNNSVSDLSKQLHGKRLDLQKNLATALLNKRNIKKKEHLFHEDLLQLDFLREEETFLRQRIARTLMQIEECGHQISQGKTWGSTDTPRHIFNHLSKKEAQKHHLPTLNNGRIQTVRDARGNLISAVGRSAAITDFSHGEISLQELLDYRKLLDLQKRHVLFTAENTMLQELYQFTNKKDFENLIQKMKTNIIASYGPTMYNGDRINFTALEEIIRDRQENLEAQFLQDLHAHLRTQNHEIAGKLRRIGNEDHFVFGRTALLDPTKNAKDEHGFINSERTQALDMLAIYNRLDGSMVRFDMTNPEIGPYIDREGVIHMPQSLKPEGGRDMKMSTVFMNVSVQGKVCNNGIQKFINDAALVKLQFLANRGLVNQEELNDLQKSLIERSNPRNPDDPFKTAHLAVRLLQHSGYVSVDCYGGKDRTGYELALVTHDSLQSILKGEALELTPAQKQTLVRFDMELLQSNGVAALIVKDNTGHAFLKLMRKELELYHLETESGKQMRKDHYKGAAKVFICAKMKIKTSVESIDSHLTYHP